MIRSLMESYIDGHGGKELGFSLLQRRSGVSTSSLRRILQGEQQPSFANAVKLLSIVAANHRESRAALQQMFPDIIESVGNIFSEAALEGAMEGQRLEDLQKHLLRTPHCQIIYLCANAVGVTLDEARKAYGVAGVEALRELLEDDLLIERQGRLRLMSDNFNFSDVSVMKRVSVALMEEFDLRNIGTHRATIGHVSDAVNEDGLKEIQKATRECLKRLSSIRDDPRYRGCNVFYSVVATNTFNSAEDASHA